MTDVSKRPPGFIPTRSIPWDSSWPSLASQNDRHFLFSYMEERFGIKKSLFEAYFLFSRSKGWWILKDSHHLLTATHLKVATAGMKAFHRVGQFIKPTTRMIQYFGRWATRSVLEMKTEQMEAILSEGHLSLDLQNEEGYVILVHRGSVLGLGLYVKNRIFPQLPREAKRCLSAFPSFPPPHSAE